MIRPTRSTLVLALSLLGVCGLVSQTSGQAPAQRDPRVQPSGTGTGAAAAPRTAASTAPSQTPSTAAETPAGPMKVGSIDIDRVLKEYEKFKVANQTLKAEAEARYKQVVDLANEGKAEQEKHAKFAPGSADAKRCEDKITQLKAQIEALRENSQREFAQKEAETMALIYNEVASMVKSVSKQRGLTFVVKYSDAPAVGTDPDSVVAAMSRTMIFADPSVDITNDVVAYLNWYYRQNAAPKPSAPPAGINPTSTAPATTPPASRTAGQAPVTNRK